MNNRESNQTKLKNEFIVVDPAFPEDRMMKLQLEPINGDGNCGFNLIRDDEQSVQEVRDKVVKTLKNLDDNEKELIYEEIMDVLVDLNCNLKEDDVLTRAREKIIELQNKLSMKERKLKKRLDAARKSIEKAYQLPEILQPAAEYLYNYLNEQENEILKRHADKLKKIKESMVALEYAKREIYSDSTVFEHYLDLYKNNLWLGYRAARAYAKARGWVFYLWQRVEKDGQEHLELMQKQCVYSDANQPKKIFGVFTHGNHFNGLELMDYLDKVDHITPEDNSRKYRSDLSFNALRKIITRKESNKDKSDEECIPSKGKIYSNFNAVVDKKLKKNRYDVNAFMQQLDKFTSYADEQNKELDTSITSLRLDINVEIWQKPGNLNLAELLIDAIKIGDDIYLDFCKLLINDEPQWLDQLEKKIINDTIKFNKKSVLPTFFMKLFANECSKVFLELYEYIDANLAESSTATYQFSIYSLINGKNGVRERSTHTFFEKITDEVNARFKNLNGKIDSGSYKYKVSKQVKELIQQFTEQMKPYWPETKEDFYRLGIIPSAMTHTELKKIAAFCLSEANKWIKISGDCDFAYEAKDIKFNTDSLKKKCQNDFDTYKEELARKLWKSRHRLIPTKYQHIAKSANELIALIHGKYVAANYCEKKTGDNLALLAKKYGNEKLYLFIKNQCGLSAEDLLQPNHHGLSLIEYQATDARGWIDMKEPFMNDFLSLEKQIRQYANAWEKRNENRKVFEKSYNPVYKFKFMVDTWRDGFGPDKPFRQRKAQIDKLLILIEFYRYHPEKIDEFIDEFSQLTHDIQDGLFGFLGQGKLKKITTSQLGFFEKNRLALTKIPESSKPKKFASRANDDTVIKLRNKNDKYRKEKQELALQNKSIIDENLKLQDENNELKILSKNSRYTNL